MVTEVKIHNMMYDNNIIHLQKPKQATGKLPDSFAKDDFIRTPPPDRLCVKCDRVPFNPQRSVCCNRLYCESCSKKNKRCRKHKADLDYNFDKELYGNIQKLKIKCPNRGDGCDWSDLVLNLKNHLPACGKNIIVAIILQCMYTVLL